MEYGGTNQMTCNLPFRKRIKFRRIVLVLLSFCIIGGLLSYLWVNSTTLQTDAESRFTRTRPVTFEKIDELLHDFDEFVDLYPELNPSTVQRTWVLAYGVSNLASSTHYLKVNASAVKDQGTVHRVTCTFDGNVASDSNRDNLILRISRLFFELDEVELNELIESDSSEFLVEGYQMSSGEWTCKLVVSDYDSLVIEYSYSSQLTGGKNN